MTGGQANEGSEWPTDDSLMQRLLLNMPVKFQQIGAPPQQSINLVHAGIVGSPKFLVNGEN